MAHQLYFLKGIKYLCFFFFWLLITNNCFSSDFNKNILEEEISNISFQDLENQLIKTSTDSTQTLAVLNQTLEKAKTSGTSEELANAYLQLSTFYLQYNDYEKALVLNLKALEINKLKKNTQLKIQIDQNIAFIKAQTGNIEGALEIYLRNLDILKKKKRYNNQEEIQVINTLISIANAYLNLKEYTKAETYANQVLIKSKKLNNIEAQIIANYSIGGVYSGMKKYDLALEKLEEAFKLAQKSDSKLAYKFINFYKGKVFFDQEYYKKAFQEFKEITDSKNDLKFNYLQQQELYSLLAQIYQRESDHENSTYYYNKALVVFNEIDRQRIQLNTSLINEYDKGVVEEEIDDLSEISETRKTQLYILLSVASIIAISFFVFYKKNKAKNQRRYDALILELNKQQAKKEVSKPQKIKKPTKRLEGEKVAELIVKLETFEKEEGYLNKEITLFKLANKLNTNTNYLSKMINQEKGLTFSKYLAELRLNYALFRLKNDKRFRSYTIKGIAEDSGFANAEPFAKAFKKKTGIYPSYFIKKLESEEVKKASA